MHEDGFDVRVVSGGRFQFYDRAGWPLPDRAPPLPVLSRDWLARTLGRNRKLGVDPGGWSLSATWKRDRDIPWDEEARVNDVIDPK